MRIHDEWRMIRRMTDTELNEIEALAERVKETDLSTLDREQARELTELVDDVPWLLAEVRRLRRGPGRLGALLRYRRIEQKRSPEEVARDASLRPEAGGVDITPEEVRALEEGTQPAGARWPDVLHAIGAVLGLPAADLRHD
jgi:hypothetical protein